MKRKVIATMLAATLALSLAGCGGSSSSSDSSKSSSSSESSTANKDKPLCWFNRQPSNSSTGELDQEALNFNKDTYYVGFDANQGAELQGQMVVDYIKANADKIDRNGDGVIGYVLAIGDIGHNDSIARTRGVRSALGTGVETDGDIESAPAGTNVDGASKVVQDATLEIDGKTFTIRELASQEMKNAAGATWDAATAGNAIGTWTASFGDEIDVVVSNNDGMGMSMFNAWAKDSKVPTFGYDANSDAVAAIGEGYGGTISQHADVQAYLTLRVLRNSLDGVDIDTGPLQPLVTGLDINGRAFLAFGSNVQRQITVDGIVPGVDGQAAAGNVQQGFRVDGIVDGGINSQCQVLDRQAGLPVLRIRAGLNAVFPLGGNGQAAGTAEDDLGAVLALDDGILRVLIVRVIFIVVLLPVRQGAGAVYLNGDLSALVAGNGSPIRSSKR